ncbi:hypothetical protein BGW80DRAFT_1442750 [Lactifluus volemus]|nr:hypothetical protein BGW80DRAFT_1442750 [Lactifluus volemus]
MIPCKHWQTLVTWSSMVTYIQADLLLGLKPYSVLRALATFERIEHFSALLIKLLNKLTKEHIQAQSASPGFESGERLTSVLEICQVSVLFLGEQRKSLLATPQGSDVGLNGAHGYFFHDSEAAQMELSSCVRKILRLNVLQQPGGVTAKEDAVEKT